MPHFLLLPTDYYLLLLPNANHYHFLVPTTFFFFFFASLRLCAFAFLSSLLFSSLLFAPWRSRRVL